MKRFLAMAMVCIMLLSLAACSKGDAGNSDESTGSGSNTPATQEADDGAGNEEGGEVTGEAKKVYIVAPQASGGSWGRLDQGMQDACAALGWDGTYLAPVTPYDNVAMADLCETAVNAGADVLMTFTADETVFTDVLEGAKERGVLTVAIAKPNFACDLRVGTDDTNLGQNLAEALVEAMGDRPIYVVELMTDVTSEGQLAQVEPFEERLLELRPDAVIVGREDSGSNAATTADDLSAMYVADDNLNCAVSFDSMAAIGAVSFKTDRALDDFIIIGIDDNAEILVNIRDGYIYSTVAQQWYDFGVTAVNIAQDILENGAEYEFFQNIETIIVHQDEVENYAAENNISLE